MSELNFTVHVNWSGTGRDGAGEIRGDHVAAELSTPASMGGRGVGTNPEELLVFAVSSCYTATLSHILANRELPVDSLEIEARGSVAKVPGKARFSSIALAPTIVGGDEARLSAYEAAAVLAHERCLIGNALGRDVIYEVSPVNLAAHPQAEGEPTVEPNADEAMPAWLSGA